MRRIEEHPILEIRPADRVKFLYEGKEVTGHRGYTIAAALHQAGYPIHSHSLRERNRSLECGIGKYRLPDLLPVDAGRGHGKGHN